MSLQRPCERRSVQLNPSHSGPTDPCPSWEIYLQAWCHDARVQFSFALTSWATYIWGGQNDARALSRLDRRDALEDRVSTAKVGANQTRNMIRKNGMHVSQASPGSAARYKIRRCSQHQETLFEAIHISMTCYPRNVLCSSGSPTSTTTTIHLHCRTTAEDVQYFFPIQIPRW